MRGEGAETLTPTSWFLGLGLLREGEFVFFFFFLLAKREGLYSPLKISFKYYDQKVLDLFYNNNIYNIIYHNKVY